MNMAICGCRNFRKHGEVKDSDNFVIFDILLKFGSMYNISITSSDPKYYLGRSGKGLITFLGIKTNVWSKKYENARYNITNISMKDISKIIKEFEELPYKGYVW